MTYYDLGAYSRPITTKSAEAQVWFDRGLNWVFGFHHAEAIRCFGKARERIRLAMAQWGISYAAGPNYNCLGISTIPLVRPKRSPLLMTRCRRR